MTIGSTAARGDVKDMSESKEHKLGSGVAMKLRCSEAGAGVGDIE